MKYDGVVQTDLLKVSVSYTHTTWSTTSGVEPQTEEGLYQVHSSLQLLILE